MHRQPVPALIFVCSLMLLAAGCGGGSAAPPAQRMTDGAVALRILPETLSGGAAGTFSLDSRAEDGGLTAVVRVDEASALNACYFELAYDEVAWHPVSASAAATLAPTGELAVLNVLHEPGVVSCGQAALDPDGRPGFAGSGVLATVRFAPGPARRPSAAPGGNASRGTIGWDPSTRTLSWHYFNQGDYDQNGEVNVADLSPLARYIRQSGPFAPNSIQEVVDGDANGEINLADITPIGVNFRAYAAGYRIYRSADSGDIPTVNSAPSTIAPAAEIGFQQAVGDRTAERLRFSYTLDESGRGDYFWVRPYDGSGEGASYHAAGGDDELSIRVVNPPQAGDGSADSPFLLDAQLEYQIEMLHSTAGDVSTAPQSEYVVEPAEAAELTNADAILRPADAFAGDFTISGSWFGATAEPQLIHFRVEGVEPVNEPPQVTLAADPQSGLTPLGVAFTAQATDDGAGPLSFEWDFDGDGTYDAASGSDPVAFHTYEVADDFNATVRATDSGGLSATASIAISAQLDLGNEPPVADIAYDRSVGAPPLLVNFDGSGSFDFDGTIANYQWDFDGDGVFDLEGADAATGSHTYTAEGIYTAALVVSDDDGALGEAQVSIRAVVSSWTAHDIGPAGLYGAWPNLVDAGGLPGVAFLVEDDWEGVYRIEYRRALDAEVSGFGPARTLSIPGEYGFAVSDAQVVDGRPAVVYYGGSDLEYGLYYTRASDAFGDSWGSPVRLDNGAYNGYAQLQVVDGSPAVAYVNEVFTEDDYLSDLSYIRATDSTGAGWGSPLRLDYLPEASGVTMGFDLLDGRPALAFFDGYSSTLNLGQAADAAGSSWSPEREILSEADGSYAPSLLAGSRLPALVFNDPQARLNFMPATDMSGAEFAPAQVLDERVSSYADDYGPRIAWVEGPAGESVPAIAYFREGENDGELTPTEVMYIEANDPQGSSWQAPEVVYTGQWGCIQIDMVAIGGVPHIVFSDTWDYRVVYATPQ